MIYLCGFISITTPYSTTTTTLYRTKTHHYCLVRACTTLLLARVSRVTLLVGNTTSTTVLGVLDVESEFSSNSINFLLVQYNTIIQAPEEINQIGEAPVVALVECTCGNFGWSSTHPYWPNKTLLYSYTSTACFITPSTETYSTW
jgi:hypothetical protein